MNYQPTRTQTERRTSGLANCTSAPCFRQYCRTHRRGCFSRHRLLYNPIFDTTSRRRKTSITQASLLVCVFCYRPMLHALTTQTVARTPANTSQKQEKEALGSLFPLPSLEKQDTWYPTLQKTVWVLQQLHDFVQVRMEYVAFFRVGTDESSSPPFSTTSHKRRSRYAVQAYAPRLSRPATRQHQHSMRSFSLCATCSS